jgi:hypothetical protein
VEHVCRRHIGSDLGNGDWVGQRHDVSLSSHGTQRRGRWSGVANERNSDTRSTNDNNDDGRTNNYNNDDNNARTNYNNDDNARTNYNNDDNARTNYNDNNARTNNYDDNARATTGCPLVGAAPICTTSHHVEQYATPSSRCICSNSHGW